MVAIVQARIGSTRLPGKVLRPLAGKPMVLHVLERAAAIQGVDEVVAAIPELVEDDTLAEVVARSGYRVIRGSAGDVLSRYVAAARSASAKAVVRVTADCPLLSPRVSTRVLRAFVGCDYASNTLVRTYPRGLDTEVMSVDAMQCADREATEPSEREHVTPFIWRRPDRFRLRHVIGSPDRSSMRWTVDTPEDMAFATAIFNELGGHFEVEDVIGLLAQRPELSRFNDRVAQEPVG
jgi:spore coat polysaccharide biosynthesis protein SpsF